MAKPLFNQEIKPEVLKQLNIAKSSIHIVMAWFNDVDIYDAILKKTQNNQIEIKLILSEESDDNSTNAQLNFQELINRSDSIYVFKIPKESVMVHHKFCVIDNKTVISGSYNWTFGANLHNLESVVLIENDPDLCKPFLDEFKNIYDAYCRPIIESSISKIDGLFAVIKKDIEHGNLKLANNIDDLVQTINSKYLSVSSDSAGPEITFENFDHIITTSAPDEIIELWWSLLPQHWKMFFLEKYLKLSREAKPGIASIRNLLSAIEVITLLSDNDLMDGTIMGLKNLHCIREVTSTVRTLKSLDYFDTLSNMQVLNISNTQISRMGVLSGISSINYLSLSNNNIDTLEDTLLNKSLKSLELHFNPLSNLNGIDNFPALDLFTCDIRFRDFPMEINKLKEIGLSEMKIASGWKNKTKISYLEFRR